MRIPNELKIGAHTIKVEFRSTPLETENSAHSDKEKNLIVIDGDLAQSQKEVTLFHEALHFMNSSIDHALLDSLAEQLYQVLSDNKMLK